MSSAEIIPIEPDVDNAAEGKMIRLVPLVWFVALFNNPNKVKYEYQD